MGHSSTKKRMVSRARARAMLDPDWRFHQIIDIKSTDTECNITGTELVKHPATQIADLMGLEILRILLRKIGNSALFAEVEVFYKTNGSEEQRNCRYLTFVQFLLNQSKTAAHDSYIGISYRHFLTKTTTLQTYHRCNYDLSLALARERKPDPVLDAVASIASKLTSMTLQEVVSVLSRVMSPNLYRCNYVFHNQPITQKQTRFLSFGK